jgi:predicted CoA-substrate-specific enzyme activase
MSYFAGIDIGSSQIKLVIVNQNTEIAGKYVTPTGSSFNKNAMDAFNHLTDSLNIDIEEINYIVSTGYGRKLFKLANENISEITANATGSIKAAEEFGQVRTIINIGGQDSKVIQLDSDGIVQNFVMNDKCAAGTGRFLDMAARNLEIDIEEMQVYHEKGRSQPLAVNSTCAVFAESEIISLLAEGHKKEEIAAGIHFSIGRRIARLAARLNVEDLVLFDGGTALNGGMKDALEIELMRDIIIPDNPTITTALGAALKAREFYHLKN